MAAYVPQALHFAESAPVIAQSTGVIDGTPAEVWAVLCDHGSWPQWFAAVISAEATSDPPSGVGSTRVVRLKGGGTFTEEFIAWDEPEVWAFTGTDGPPFVNALVERVTLRELGPRLTEITYRMALGPRPGLTPLVKLVRPVIEHNLKKALRDLNAVVVDRRRAH